MFYNQHPRTIERGLKSGKLDIPYLRIGRNILIRREDIADYEARRLYRGVKNCSAGTFEGTSGAAEAQVVPTSPTEVVDQSNGSGRRDSSFLIGSQQRAGP
jgi:hypothetical protein